jgi:AMP deaminase
MSDLDAGKYQLVEWRVSIYGRKASEWEALAKWFYTHRLAHQNVRWLIQIPRLFGIYRSNGDIRSFHQMLYNIFMPLIEVTLDPASNIPLHYFLQTVVGIDSVDDESRPESQGLYMPDLVDGRVVHNIPNPEEWTKPENPPYGYWMYYLSANLCVLNQLRAARGMTTFQFRPHCGEAGLMFSSSFALCLLADVMVL